MNLRKLIIDINNIVIFKEFSLTQVELVLISFNLSIELLNIQMKCYMFNKFVFHLLCLLYNFIKGYYMLN